MYEIWMENEDIRDGQISQRGFFVSDIGAKKRQQLQDAGFHLKMAIKAKNREEAQQKFVKWCNDQCPSIRRTDFSWF